MFYKNYKDLFRCPKTNTTAQSHKSRPKNSTHLKMRHLEHRSKKLLQRPNIKNQNQLFKNTTTWREPKITTQHLERKKKLFFMMTWIKNTSSLFIKTKILG